MHPDILVQLVALANTQGERLQALPKDTHMAAFEAMVLGAEMVWAVWQDPALPHGVGTILVKGGRDARRMERRRRLKGDVAAVPCRSRFEAEAVNDALGDGSTRITAYAAPPPEVVPHLDEAVRQRRRRDAELDEVVADGTANRGRVDAGELTVAQVFDGVDILRGVFPEGGGMAVEALKGDGRLMLAVQSGKGFQARVAALLFRDRAEAEDARRRHGDGRSAGDPLLRGPARDWALRKKGV